MGNFKIKKDKEKLSDKEIEQQMNFDRFISGYTAPVKGWFSGTTKLFTIVASTAVVLTIAGYLMYSSGKTTEISATPFVNPPIPSLAQPLDIYISHSERDTTIIHSTGTLITVPSSAFADDEGKDVAGDIQIHYREFHDPIDLLLSGIPMNYDSAGTTYQLESGGMFEITATKEGKPVHLKAGKTLLVNMISGTNNSTDYNIYNLDTVKKQWEYISENTAQNNTCFPVFETKVPNIAIATNQYDASIQKPVLPEKSKPEALNFTIDYRKDEFPELAVYNGIKFEPVGGDSKKYNSLSKQIWDDVSIEKDADDKHYIITFRNEKKTLVIKALPVVEEKDYEATMKEYAIRQQRYKALLAAKRKSDRSTNDSLYAINARFTGGVPRSDLNERFKNFMTDSYNETFQDMLAYRTFAVSKLGFWNCDKPISFFANEASIQRNAEGSFIASFASADNEVLNMKNVFLIRRDKNSIYSVPESSFSRFPSCEEAVDIMVGITYENRIVYLKDQDLKRVESKGTKITFKMNKIDKNIENPKQLKDLLKI
jgi:hypothetical protein